MSLKKITNSATTGMFTVTTAIVMGFSVPSLATSTSTNNINFCENGSSQFAFIKKQEENEPSTDIQTNVNRINKTETSNNLDQIIEETSNSNWDILLNSFNRDFDKNSNLVTVSDDVLYKGFSRLAFNLAQLDFIKASVELLEDNGIKFSMKFENEKLLIVSNSLVDYEDLKSDDLVISLFDNKKRIVSDVFKIESFVEGFNRYISA